VPEDLTQLVALARHGDADAYARILTRMERAGLAVAYAIVGERAQAQDVLQDAAWQAWQHLADLHEPAGFPGWFLQIVRRIALDSIRRHKRYEFALRDWADFRLQLQPTDRAADTPHDLVGRALSELDEPTRIAVMMRYFDAQSAQAIAAVLDCTPAAVDMRLSRARAQLRQRLAPLLPTLAQRDLSTGVAL